MRVYIVFNAFVDTESKHSATLFPKHFGTLHMSFHTFKIPTTNNSSF